MNIVQHPPVVEPDPFAPPAALATPDSDFNLRELLMKIWRRKGVLIGTVVVVAAIVLLYIQQLTPRYTASAEVLLSGRETNLLSNIEAVVPGLWADASTIESEIQVIRSRDMAAKTIEKLDLDGYPEFNAELRQPPRWRELLSWRRYVPAGWLAPEQPVPEPTAAELEQQQRRHAADLIDTFLSKLDVQPIGRSRVIRISFESENPQLAAAIANALADYYVVSQLDAKYEATRAANDWLNDRIAELQAQVLADEQAVAEYRAQAGLIGTDDGFSTVAEQQVTQLNTELVQASAQLSGLQVRLRQTRQLAASPNSADIETAAEVLQSPLIQRLWTEQSTLERRLAELSQQYGERHPQIQAVQAELAGVRASLSAEINKVVQGLENEAAVAEARLQSLQQSFRDAMQEASVLNESEVQLRALMREAEASRSLLETFLARSKETTAQASFVQADAVIISPAAPPAAPSFPNTKKLMAMGIFAAVLLGLGLVFAIELLFDRGFRSMDQIERATALPPLGLIPSVPGRRSNPAAYLLKHPVSAFAESLRTLYTGLVLSNGNRRVKTVMITSAVPKEGKTSTVLSLAYLMAGMGKRVIVVDCDLRHPSLSKVLRLRAKPGLVDYFNGRADLDTIIQEHSKTGLKFITGGYTGPNPVDVLGSSQMHDLLEALAEQYDMVLIDTAPVLAVADTRALSRLVDKIVFVARWAHTRQETVIGGLKLIADGHTDVAGVLLTMVDVRKHARYGYRDSGYYYGAIKKYYSG